MTASGPCHLGAESVEIAKLKLTAAARRTSLRPRAQGGSVLFEERNTLDPATVVRMIQKTPREYRSKARSNCACPDRSDGGSALRVRRRADEASGREAGRA